MDNHPTTQQPNNSFFLAARYVLLTALILSLPMNLFWQIDPNLGYYGGLRVDYLIPKIFLSDVVGILVVGCWLLVRLGVGFPSFAKGYRRAQQVSGFRKTYNEKLSAQGGPTSGWKTQNVAATSTKLQKTNEWIPASAGMTTPEQQSNKATNQPSNPSNSDVLRSGRVNQQLTTNNELTNPEPRTQNLEPSNQPHSTFHIPHSIIHHPSIYLPILFLLLFIRQFFTAVPMASVWFFLSTSLHVAVGVVVWKWIRNSILNNTTTQLPNNITTPIITTAVALSLLLQSSLGLYQFVTQHQLLPYRFLGEPQLSRDLNLSKANFAVVDRMLGTHLGYRILPYGTTPHPNVLGGWLAVGVLVMLGVRCPSFAKGYRRAQQVSGVRKTHNQQLNNTTTQQQSFIHILRPRRTSLGLALPTFKSLLLTLAMVLGFVTLLLTTSLSAMITFLIGIVVVLGVRFPSFAKGYSRAQQVSGFRKTQNAAAASYEQTHNQQLNNTTTQQQSNIHLPLQLTTYNFQLLFLFLLLIVAVPVIVHFANQWTNGSDASLRRRDVLSQLAVTAFVTHPVFGIGMNQSSLLPLQTDFNLQEVTLFAQPIHNVPLLFLAENGLLGVAAIIVLGMHLASSKRYPKLVLFVILLPILTLDHYLYTLSVGQGIWIAALLLRPPTGEAEC